MNEGERPEFMSEEADRQVPLNSANSALKIIERVKDDHLRNVCSKFNP